MWFAFLNWFDEVSRDLGVDILIALCVHLFMKEVLYSELFIKRINMAGFDFTMVIVSPPLNAKSAVLSRRPAVQNYVFWYPDVNADAMFEVLFCRISQGMPAKL